MKHKLPIGVVYALAAAALFGASTPLSKLLLGTVDVDRGLKEGQFRGVREGRAELPGKAD